MLSMPIFKSVIQNKKKWNQQHPLIIFDNEKSIKLTFDHLFVQEFKELPSEDLKEYCCVNQRNLVEILKEYKG